ncbi:glycyl-radical enzyme activating protein [Lachnospiraceae bacterium LCP25S3_G4]
MKIFQKGFNYSQDGEGNRLVYHLQGCNMRCPWCANPEGMKNEGVLMIDTVWLLDTICPYHAICDGTLNRKVCKSCDKRECITEHKTKGIKLSYEEVSIVGLVEEVLSNRLMYYDGGGVTFTGGEATMQFYELLQALQLLQEQGIHTALETNGSHERLQELFSYVNQLIIDCKLCNNKKHQEIMGISNEQILENIRIASKIHPQLHIRVPLIGEVNDSKEDQEDFIRFFKEIKGENVTFEILTYHELGRQKWEQCGLKYRMKETAYIEKSKFINFKENIIKSGAKYWQT